MRVFVTGASGWIGSAVVPELLSAGHEVIGLARSDLAAAKLAKQGAKVARGDLDDLDSVEAGAKGADGVIHLAFKHDVAFAPGGMAVAAASERQVIDRLGAVLSGTGRPLVIASGTPAIPGRVATEHDAAPSEGPAAPRGANARAAVALADQQVRVSVVRLPRSVHGKGDAGFIAMLVGMARDKGVSGFVGDGSSRWPAVHVLDAAHLFRLALENAQPGSVWHAVGDEGVPTLDIAGAIGRQLNIPVVAVPAEELGLLGMVLSIDQPASSSLTGDTLGWRASHAGLIDDIDAGHYVATLREGQSVR